MAARFFSAKKFLVLLAICILMMSLVCIASAGPPIENGVQFSVPNRITESSPMLEWTSDVTYTITGLSGYADLWGWTGSEWTRIKDGGLSGVYTFTPSVDFPAYTQLIFTDSAPGASAVLTWDEPSPVEAMLGLVTPITMTFFSIGTSLVTWVMSTPLALLGVALCLVAFFVISIRKTV